MERSGGILERLWDRPYTGGKWVRYEGRGRDVQWASVT